MDRVSEEENSVNEVGELREGWGGSDRVDPRKESGFQSSNQKPWGGLSLVTTYLQ